MLFFWICAIVGFLWGLWSIRMQYKYHPNHVEWWKILLVFIINAIAFPLTIPTALYRRQIY